jgi:hypothetical protein
MSSILLAASQLYNRTLATWRGYNALLRHKWLTVNCRGANMARQNSVMQAVSLSVSQTADLRQLQVPADDDDDNVVTQVYQQLALKYETQKGDTPNHKYLPQIV